MIQIVGGSDLNLLTVVTATAEVRIADAEFQEFPSRLCGGLLTKEVEDGNRPPVR